MSDQDYQGTAAGRGIGDWVRDNLGGEVIRVDQVIRWRPIWRVDIDRDGIVASLAFKGPKDGGVIPFPVDHEYKMLGVLAENGIPVPRVHGMCDSPRAVVMDWMPGGRDPGMVMMAAEDESVMSDERWSASLKYMDWLAAMHKIEPAKFLAAGLEMPQTPEQIALNCFERFYQLGVEKKIVDPFMDFCAIWLRRNVPQQRSRVSFVTGDCCQFLSVGDEVTTLLDVEIGYLGDPMSDLACFLGRHPVENLGDIPALFRHYEKSFGESIDLEALAYQTVVFMGVAFYFPVLTLPVTMPGGDWVESQVQVAFCGRRCAEALAGIIGVELDHAMSLPEPAETSLEDMALEKLSAEIANMPSTEYFQPWKRDIVGKIPGWLTNQLHYGQWAKHEDSDDVAELLGHRPENRLMADIALSKFVLEAGPEHDADLVRFFHRRTLRECHICVGPDASPKHIIFAKFEPVTSL